MKLNSELIKYAKCKGIKFDKCSVSSAESFISNKNNYFKVTSYRKNFQKYQKGRSAGKYINLDFQNLIDLSIIDTTLRHVVLHMTLDIEHFIKLDLLNILCDKGENEYEIVEAYKESLSKSSKDLLNSELERNSKNIYTKDIYKKYKKDLPVWAFLEIISFGSLLFFYKFLATRYKSKKMMRILHLLYKCKSIRNAAAHNNCILNDLTSFNSKLKLDYELSSFIAKSTNFSKATRKKRFSNDRIIDIVSLLYTYTIVVNSTSSMKYTKLRLEQLIECIDKYLPSLALNKLLWSTFSLIKSVIFNLFNE